jgi:hypothetical protein
MPFRRAPSCATGPKCHAKHGLIKDTGFASNGQMLVRKWPETFEIGIYMIRIQSLRNPFLYLKGGK